MGLQSFSQKTFFTKAFCESLGINLSMGRNTGRGNVAYNWISPDPAKPGPTLGGVVVVVVVVVVNTRSGVVSFIKAHITLASPDNPQPCVITLPTFGISLSCQFNSVFKPK